MQQPPAQLQPEQPQPVQPELPKGFQFIKRLGKGNDGEVLLCQYQGTDKLVKSLCDSQNYIAVKIANPGLLLDPNEVTISQELIQTASEKQTDLTKINPVHLFGKCFLSRFLPYKKSEGQTPLSSDLQTFFIDVVRNIGPVPAEDNIAAALQGNLSVSLSQLTSSMHSAQATVHAAGKIHGDTATRNFLLLSPKLDEAGNVISFAVAIIDFSRTKNCRDNESIPLPGPKPPVRYLNTAAYDTHMVNAATDLFALRCSIIEMAGLALGATHPIEVLSLGTDPKDNQEYFKQRLGECHSDSKTLDKYLANIDKLLENCQDVNKKAEMALFINCYREYLTNMPAANMTNKEARLHDKHMLLKANQKFVHQCFVANNNPNNPSPNYYTQLKLLANRLIAIEVSDDFKKTPFYEHLQKVARKEEKVNIFTRAARNVATAIAQPIVTRLEKDGGRNEKSKP